MNLKLCFFDIDGTLIRRGSSEGQSLKTRSINYAMRKVFEIPDIDYISILGKRIYGLTDITIMKMALAEYGVDSGRFYKNLENLFVAIDEYFKTHEDDSSRGEYVRLPSINAFLSYLAERKVRMGLVTGNIKRHSLWKMKNAGFDGYFETGAYGDDAENRWEIMTVALERNKDIGRGSICHFGDSPADLDAARRCGIRAVAISEKGGGTHSRAELEAVGYGLVIDGWHQTDLIEKYLSLSGIDSPDANHV